MNSINNSDNIRYSHDNVEQFQRMIRYMPEGILNYRWRWAINYSNQFYLTYRGANETVRINFGASEGRIVISRYDNFTETIIDSSDIYVCDPAVDDSASFEESRRIFEVLLNDAILKCG